MQNSLQERLTQANHIVVFTGAGMSAESGIATFRDPGGLWQRFSPQELASMDGFLANPTRVLEWYEYRRNVINDAQPNAGHYAIAELQKRCQASGKEFTLVTQNVDRLHQRAGSVNVLEVHGNLEENKCSVGRTNCDEPVTDAPHDTVDAQETVDAQGANVQLVTSVLPTCVVCGALMRPNVVWFGEELPQQIFADAEHAAMNADVFMSVGTSAEVYPAAGLPMLAQRRGAYMVEVNPHATAQSMYFHHTIRNTSAFALPEIANMLESVL
ncbi:MAG: NAD-dependent deacylase [Ignavibacteria bacterium]|nr:NAD-dependent deacylase [Ignavibacteria bacterium]